MRLLLDENLPKRLKRDLSEHEIFSVRDKGWQGKENGELLKLLLDEQFDCLITFDKNLTYQQNFQKYSFPVVVLHAEDNSYAVLQQLVPAIKKTLSEKLRAGANIVKKES